jgi:acetyltransferase-like isoleucine patch superfamily enzyme
MIAARMFSAYTRVKRAVGRRWWTAVVRGQVAECGAGLRVNGPSVVNGGRNVKLGSNVHFNGMTIFGGGGLTVGDNFHSGLNCRIFTENHRYEDGDQLPYDGTVVKKAVTVGDNVWLGDSVIVLPGATIGDGVVVGAGSVVAGEVEPLSVVAGNPAVPIKTRDREHYDRLVSERKFH